MSFLGSNKHSVLAFEYLAESRETIIDALGHDSEIIFHSFQEPFLQELEKKHYDIIFIDVTPDKNSILKLLKITRSSCPSTPIIITSEAEKAEFIVEAIKLGAYDFVTTPFNSTKIRLVVERALKQLELQYEIEYLRGQQNTIYNFDKIIGESPEFKEAINNLKRFAKTDSTILITGNTGTGKSFLSGSIHYNSPRKDKPFIKINCANITELVLESELFGHEKGAFAGAEKQRIGRFEQANGGTIFLDEIGEIGLEVQSKLLRILEEKSFERIGGNKTIHVDVRIIAATNKDLAQQIANGKFREDLFYRINVLPIHLPPLKRRPQCIKLLADVLLQKACATLNKKIEGFSPSAMVTIKKYDWPGNIRQLANTIERAAILEDGSLIQPESISIPDPRKIGQSPFIDFCEPLEVQERELILKALKENSWVQKNAAKALGISPRAMNYKVNKFNIIHPTWRKNK